VGAIAYMGAYLSGSVIAMVLVVLGISLVSSSRRGKFRPVLFGAAGGLSIATGFFWLQKTSTHLF